MIPNSIGTAQRISVPISVFARFPRSLPTVGHVCPGKACLATCPATTLHSEIKPGIPMVCMDTRVPKPFMMAWQRILLVYGEIPVRGSLKVFAVMESNAPATRHTQCQSGSTFRKSTCFPGAMKHPLPSASWLSRHVPVLHHPLCPLSLLSVSHVSSCFGCGRSTWYLVRRG